jgi:hypothetical protein
MTVALGSTLITLGTSTLIEKGRWLRIEDGRVNGSNEVFIGAIVTRTEQTFPDIRGADEDDTIAGICIGINTTRHTLPNVTSGNAAFYNDFDQPFSDNDYVRFGVPEAGGVYLVLSETNTTIAVGDPLMVTSAGVLKVAGTGDIITFIAEEAVTGASNTKKYFRARYIG